MSRSLSTAANHYRRLDKVLNYDFPCRFGMRTTVPETFYERYTYRDVHCRSGIKNYYRQAYFAPSERFQR